jgi:hypothetical protein
VTTEGFRMTTPSNVILSRREESLFM